MSEPSKPYGEGKGEFPLTHSPPGVSPAAPPPVPADRLSIEDFRKLQLRIGTIVSAQDHPNADRLLVLTVDIGETSPRQVVAGIRGSYQASALVGKQVVFVANLASAMLRGIESQGMVLAASEGERLVLVSPDQQIRPGSQVR